MASQSVIQCPSEVPTQTYDEQEYVIVRIFLNAAIACIAHTRELIPWVSSCFQIRYANQINAIGTRLNTTYEDFCDGPSFTNDGSQEFRILVQGQDKRADRILDLVDGGVYQAITNNLLDAFQLFVATDINDAASTLETYTFSFTYKDNRINHVRMSSEGLDSIQNVHQDFGSSIRALLRSLKRLPRLPRHRSLGISLLYNDTCPRDYQPIGFVDVEQRVELPLKGSWSDLWHDLPPVITKFATKTQTVAIGTRSLQFTEKMSCSRLQDARMSAQIQKLQQTSSRDSGLDLTANPQPSAPPLEKPRQSHKITIGPTAVTLKAQLETFPKAQRNSLAELSITSKSRRRRNVVPSKLAELLVQARAMDNNYGRRREIFDRNQLSNGKVRRLERSGVVSCPCGSPHEVTHMLFCELCGTRQHKTCYGYESLRHGCLPEEHFCYDCLLLPREDKVNQSMAGLVHMRLALLFLAGQPTNLVEIGRDFLRSIFHDHENPSGEFSQVINRLIKEGYLSRGVENMVAISDDKELIATAQTMYLDPLAGIVHHYQIVRDGDTFEKRKNEILRALKTYHGTRQLALNDTTNACYDRMHVRNSVGHEVIRWGFYAAWKRKRVESSNEICLRRQKVSVSENFININRSSSSETMSIDEAVQHAVMEAEWSLKSVNRLNSQGSSSSY